jgi:isoleucyl-tRNA synthetase
MSKRLKNYPDPLYIVNEYGADSLRLYLINSPVVRAESLKFQEKGVRDIIKDVMLPWFNAYRFLVETVTKYSKVFIYIIILITIITFYCNNNFFPCCFAYKSFF